MRTVTAPYVTMRVRNPLGQEVLEGFYADAPVPAGANKEDLDRLIRKGLVSEDSDAHAADAAPANTATVPAPEPTAAGLKPKAKPDTTTTTG